VYFRKILIFLFILSVFQSCGLLPDEDTSDSGADESFSNRVPSDWDGTEDWQGSNWEVVEQ